MLVLANFPKYFMSKNSQTFEIPMNSKKIIKILKNNYFMYLIYEYFFFKC